MSRKDPTKATDSGSERRKHERFALAVHADVTVPGHPTRDFGICELSETGMFLAFTGAQLSRQSLEKHNIETGSELQIAFAVPINGRKLKCELTAKIARITDHGIGVEFLPEKPSQLFDLIDAFTAAHHQKGQSTG